MEGGLDSGSVPGADAAALGGAECGEAGWLVDLDLWAPYGWVSGASLLAGTPEQAPCKSGVLYPIDVEGDLVIDHAAV